MSKSKYYVDRYDNNKWAVLERGLLFHWVKWIDEDYYRCVEYAEKLNNKKNELKLVELYDLGRKSRDG